MFRAETFPPRFVMLDAGEETVPVGQNSLLVHDEPSDKPGDLQDVDAAQSYGCAHAERLQSRHFLETFNSTFL